MKNSSIKIHETNHLFSLQNTLATSKGFQTPCEMPGLLLLPPTPQGVQSAG